MGLLKDHSWYDIEHLVIQSNVFSSNDSLVSYKRCTNVHKLLLIFGGRVAVIRGNTVCWDSLCNLLNSL